MRWFTRSLAGGTRPDDPSSRRDAALLLVPVALLAGARQRRELGAWRFSLEDPHSWALRGCASFEALVGYLRAQLLDEPLVQSAPSGKKSG